MVFYQVFFLSTSQCTVRAAETVRGCVSLKKYKSQGKAIEVTVNSKEEKFLRLWSGFRPWIRPLIGKKKQDTKFPAWVPQRGVNWPTWPCKLGLKAWHARCALGRGQGVSLRASRVREAVRQGLPPQGSHAPAYRWFPYACRSAERSKYRL